MYLKFKISGTDVFKKDNLPLLEEFLQFVNDSIDTSCSENHHTIFHHFLHRPFV